jgi:hypothetical protein
LPDDVLDNLGLYTKVLSAILFTFIFTIQGLFNSQATYALFHTTILSSVILPLQLYGIELDEISHQTQKGAVYHETSSETIVHVILERVVAFITVNHGLFIVVR